MIYINRYKDKIEFIDQDGSVIMKGGEYLRYGIDDDNNINMVDPSGGPYIEIGNNLNEFFNDGKDRIIKEIFIHDDGQIEFKL